MGLGPPTCPAGPLTPLSPLPHPETLAAPHSLSPPPPIQFWIEIGRSPKPPDAAPVHVPDATGAATRRPKPSPVPPSSSPTPSPVAAWRPRRPGPRRRTASSTPSSPPSSSTPAALDPTSRCEHARAPPLLPLSPRRARPPRRAPRHAPVPVAAPGCAHPRLDAPGPRPAFADSPAWTRHSRVPRSSAPCPEIPLFWCYV